MNAPIKNSTLIIISLTLWVVFCASTLSALEKVGKIIFQDRLKFTRLGNTPEMIMKSVDGFICGGAENDTLGDYCNKGELFYFGVVTRLTDKTLLITALYWKINQNEYHDELNLRKIFQDLFDFYADEDKNLSLKLRIPKTNKLYTDHIEEIIKNQRKCGYGFIMKNKDDVGHNHYTIHRQFPRL